MANLSGIGRWGRQAGRILRSGGLDLLAGRGFSSMPFMVGAAYGGYTAHRRGEDVGGIAMSAGMYGAAGYMGHSLYKSGHLSKLGAAVENKGAYAAIAEAGTAAKKPRYMGTGGRGPRPVAPATAPVAVAASNPATAPAPKPGFLRTAEEMVRSRAKPTPPTPVSADWSGVPAGKIPR